MFKEVKVVEGADAEPAHSRVVGGFPATLKRIESALRILHNDHAIKFCPTALGLSFNYKLRTAMTATSAHISAFHLVPAALLDDEDRSNRF